MNLKKAKQLRRIAGQTAAINNLEFGNVYEVAESKRTGNYQLILSANCWRGIYQRLKRTRGFVGGARGHY